MLFKNFQQFISKIGTHLPYILFFGMLIFIYSIYGYVK